jgi:hypothetical protein
VFPPETPSATAPVVYEALRSLRGWEGQGPKIRRLVRHMVEDRGVPNWDTTTGSASDLAEIYKEMRDGDRYPTPGWYHSALRVRFC